MCTMNTTHIQRFKEELTGSNKKEKTPHHQHYFSSHSSSHSQSSEIHTNINYLIITTQITFLTIVSSEVVILTFSKENFKIDPTKITKFLQPLQNTDITCVSNPIKCIPNIEDTLFQLKKRKIKKKW